MIRTAQDRQKGSFLHHYAVLLHFLNLPRQVGKISPAGRAVLFDAVKAGFFSYFP